MKFFLILAVYTKLGVFFACNKVKKIITFNLFDFRFIIKLNLKTKL